MNIKLPLIDDRLYLAASLVREGGTVADVGTDHAYIPIFLINSGKCSKAIASDINSGPLERAKAHAEKYGIGDEITFCLADGLRGLPLEEKGVTDIVICGMGGELIADIINGSDYTRKPGVHLILQPMTKPEKLREYLSREGFREIGGGAVKADKVYQCIMCEYTGEPYPLTPGELMVGKNKSIRESEAFPELLDKYIKMAEKKLKSKEREAAENLIRELSEMKNESI